MIDFHLKLHLMPACISTAVLAGCGTWLGNPSEDDDDEQAVVRLIAEGSGGTDATSAEVNLLDPSGRTTAIASLTEATIVLDGLRFLSRDDEQDDGGGDERQGGVQENSRRLVAKYSKPISINLITGETNPKSIRLAGSAKRAAFIELLFEDKDIPNLLGAGTIRIGEDSRPLTIQLSRKANVMIEVPVDQEVILKRGRSVTLNLNFGLADWLDFTGVTAEMFAEIQRALDSNEIRFDSSQLNESENEIASRLDRSRWSRDDDDDDEYELRLKSGKKRNDSNKKFDDRRNKRPSSKYRSGQKSYDYHQQ